MARPYRYRLFLYSLLLVSIFFVIRYKSGDIVARYNKAKRSTAYSQHPPFLARVGKDYLYASDMKLLNELGIHTTSYIEEWACAQLLIHQYNKQCIDNQQYKSIETQLKSYKDHLIAYHCLEALAKPSFSEEVSPEEMATYYRDHKYNDFILNHDIVKGIFVALPKQATGVHRVRSLMLSSKVEDRSKIKEYCKLYANASILEADQWIAWKAVLAKVGYPPLAPDRASGLLQANKLIHTADRKHIFLLKIDQYKLAGEQEIAPLSMVKESIKAIILHKRKKALISNIKNEILQKAKKNHTCVTNLP